MPLLELGAVAPDFSVPSHTGETVRLADLRGKWVVLWFYPKADTPGWTVQGCGFRDQITAFEEKGAVVLGVSFDTVAENAAFAAKFAFPYHLLCDTSRAMGLAYGAADDDASPYAKRVGYLIGPDQRVVEVWAKADPKAHPAEALAKIA